MNKYHTLAACILLALGSAHTALASTHTHASAPSPSIQQGRDSALNLARQALAPGISTELRDERGRQAAAALASLAVDSDAEVAWHLGSLSAVGAGVAYDPDKALRQIGRAADLGQPAAAYWLANHYDGIKKTGIEPIFHRPVSDAVRQVAERRQMQYLNMAARAGHVTAMYELVAIYSAGEPHRWEEAADFWREKADIHRGRIVPVESVPLWLDAQIADHPGTQPSASEEAVATSSTPPAPVRPPAESPAPIAQSGTQADTTQLSNELVAAKLQLIEAERQLAELRAALEYDRLKYAGIPSPYDFLETHGALPPLTFHDQLNRKGLDFYEAHNYSQAAQAFEQAGLHGSVSAQANLGLMYLHGVGVEKDAKMAVKLLRESARKGNVVAAENLGFIYANGLAGKVDVRQARRWFRKAIERGSHVAPQALSQLDSLSKK